MKISILMLTFNAPRCVLESVKGVNKAKEKTNNLELIVLDNNSQFQTKNLLNNLNEIKVLNISVIIFILSKVLFDII